MEPALNSQAIITRYIYMLVTAWCVIFVVAVSFIVSEVQSNAENQAFLRAKTIAERDILYRDWVSKSGGVYIGVSDQNQPNPFLSFVHDREVVTRDGAKLTLVNPATMTRQVYALNNHDSQIINRITSLDLMNPDNAPDSWESSTLMELGRTGENIHSAMVLRDGIEYARTLVALKTDASCLECHFDQGYRVGDIRGGLSVMIPFAPFLEAEWSDSIYLLLITTLLWLLGLGVIAFFSKQLDLGISQVRESERQLNIAETSLHYLSHFDQRTNLPNRALFDDRLIQAITHSDRVGNKVAVAVMQVANFAQICDTFEYSVGDQLIRRIAETVGVCIRPDDTIARFGRESLLILLPSILVKENIPRIIDKINVILEESLDIEGHEAFVNASFGVSLYPDDSKDPMSLVKFAETAAARAGNLDRSNLQMYASELNDLAHQQLQLETGLRKALKEGQFSIYYQPQIDAPSGRVVGAEALIRWFHPEKGLITPDIFIPMAENNGTIFEIGAWVMREACKQAVAWQKEYQRPFQIGVNVSATQFQDPLLVDMIENVLAETGLSPESLEIEITEGMIMADVENAVDTLVDLKIRGVKIAIDDFGTGYSSLSQLKRFPIDRLKIDRSFVSEIDENNDDQVIVEMIIELTGKLNLAVIAEGVEKVEQRDFLVSRGCYSMQGHLFGKAVAADVFNEVLTAGV